MAFDPSKHPRVPTGSPDGGEFTSGGGLTDAQRAENQAKYNKRFDDLMEKKRKAQSEMTASLEKLGLTSGQAITVVAWAYGKKKPRLADSVIPAIPIDPDRKTAVGMERIEPLVSTAPNYEDTDQAKAALAGVKAGLASLPKTHWDMVQKGKTIPYLRKIVLASNPKDIPAEDGETKSGVKLLSGERVAGLYSQYTPLGGSIFIHSKKVSVSPERAALYGPTLAAHEFGHALHAAMKNQAPPNNFEWKVPGKVSRYGSKNDNEAFAEAYSMYAAPSGRLYMKFKYPRTYEFMRRIFEEPTTEWIKRDETLKKTAKGWKVEKVAKKEAWASEFVRFLKEANPYHDPKTGKFTFRGGHVGAIIDKVKGGGFTYDTKAGDFANHKTGYYVGYTNGGHQQIPADSITDKDVQAFVAKHPELQQPGVYLGGWRSGDNVFLDVSRHFEDLDQALDAARHTKPNPQIGIYDIAKQEDILLADHPEKPVSPTGETAHPVEHEDKQDGSHYVKVGRSYVALHPLGDWYHEEGPEGAQKPMEMTLERRGEGTSYAQRAKRDPNPGETRAAIRAGIAWARANGVSHISALTIGSNPKVLALMHKLGAVDKSGRTWLPLDKVKDSHIESLREAWEPEQHPRDQKGEFTTKGGANEPTGGTKAGGLQDGGRVQQRPGVLASSRRPLEGLPEGSPGPFPEAREVAADYMKAEGREYNPPTKFIPANAAKGAEIADAFSAMKDEPDNPKVKEAYAALAKETMGQWDAMKKTGIKIDPIDFAKTGDPYHGHAEEMFDDVRKNNHMYYFRTVDGFGSKDEMAQSKHPFLAEAGVKDDAGNPMLVNDVFRVVHDYFGHNKEGVGFDPDGEDNAWRSHLAMFSPLAGQAMTTETRGQTSWVYFGPHGADNREGKKPTVFADQKVGLLPQFTREAEFNPEEHPRDKSGKWAKTNSPAHKDLLAKGWVVTDTQTRKNPKGFGALSMTRLEPPKAQEPSEDDKDNHHAWAQAAGGKVNGYQDTASGGKYLVVTDNETRSTGLIPLDKVSPASIKAKFEDIRSRFAAEAPKKESVVYWGPNRLVMIEANVGNQPRVPTLVYGSIPMETLPDVPVQGARVKWAQSVQTAKRYAEARSVIVRTERRLALTKETISGRNIEILTYGGWQPIVPRTGRFIEVGMGRRVLDGPSTASWTTPFHKPSRRVLDRFPGLEGLVARQKQGMAYQAAVVDSGMAALTSLKAGVREDEAQNFGLGDLGMAGKDYPKVLESTLLAERGGGKGDHLLVWQVPQYQKGSPRPTQLLYAAEVDSGKVLYAAEQFPTARWRFAILCPEGGKVWAIKTEGMWVLPGGHKEPGEDRGAAAVREMLEETGLKVKLAGLLGEIHRPGFTTVVFHGTRVGDQQPIATPEEIEDVDLIDVNDLDVSERFWVKEHFPRA